jgi:hypothetical protein
LAASSLHHPSHSGAFVVGPLIDSFGGMVSPLAPGIDPTRINAYQEVMIYTGSLCRNIFGLDEGLLVHKGHQFILAQGILLGISLAMIFCTYTVYVGQWLKKKRVTVIGIIAVGSSLCAIILPIAIDRMLLNPNIKFWWTMRIVGFIMLPPLAIT